MINWFFFFIHNLFLINYLLQQKLILHRQNNFYRVKSGYFRSDEDVKNQAKEKLAVRFPEIPIEKEIKVEKVYTEYRYWQISTLKGENLGCYRYIPNMILSSKCFIFFFKKMHKTLLIIIHFLVHALKSLYLYSFSFSKFFLTQDFLTLYNHSISFP